jgi:hypothetical protein
LIEEDFTTATMSKLENTLPKPKIELYSGKYFAACAFGGVIGAYPSNAQDCQEA